MIRENRRHAFIDCSGGLELEESPTKIQAGRLISCKNFSVKSGGGYYRVKGYERFDGRPSPHESEDKEAARNLIAEVPGEGPVLGAWLFEGTVYSFRNAIGGAEAKMYKATPTGWSEVATGVTLSPSGSYEFQNYNFFGATKMRRMFGVDGVNKAFMFDGTTFTQLSVDGETDMPIHLAAHKNHLFLAYPQGQYVHSSIGEPNDWDAATGGAGSGGVGDEIIAMQPTIGGALAIMMRNRISVLYGSSQADWQSNDLRGQESQSGAIQGTVQDIGGDIIYLDDRGLTSMSQTQSFGNFEASTIDKGVSRMIDQVRLDVIGSFVSRTSNEYRLAINKSLGTEIITLTAGARGLEGFSRSLYDFGMSCVCSLEDETGSERIFAGADNGFVYEIDKGNSFDGADINAHIKLSYASGGTPKHKKRWRSADLTIDASSILTLNYSVDFDYGSQDKLAHRVSGDDVVGGGALWGEGVWGQFVYGAQIYGESSMDIRGVGRNMSITIHHSDNITPSFTIHDITALYSMRGIKR